MKKLYTLLCFVIFSASVNAQNVVLFSDDFESYADFEIATVGNWTLTDVDLLGTYGFNGVTFMNSNSAMAYIVFNPSATTPALTTNGWQVHGGMKEMACFAAVPSPPQFNDDWLISPQLTLGNFSTELSLWVRSATDAYGLERYNIGVSTTGTATSDFTFISMAPYAEADTAWENVTFDLSTYANQQIYIAVNCVSQDAFGFLVDDFEVTQDTTTAVGIEEEVTFNDQISVFPTITNTTFNVRNNSTTPIDNVSIYDMQGRLVYSDSNNGNANAELTLINIEDLAAGKYLVEIIADDQRAFKRVVKH